MATCAAGAEDATRLLRATFSRAPGRIYSFSFNPAELQLPVEVSPETLEIPPDRRGGRMFCEDREVCWDAMEAGAIELLLLCEANGGGLPPGLPDGWDVERAERLAVHQPSASAEHGIYLLGERQEGEEQWSTARVPRPLFYPSAAGRPRARLRYLLYHDEDWVVRYTRLLGFA